MDVFLVSRLWFATPEYSDLLSLPHDCTHTSAVLPLLLFLHGCVVSQLCHLKSDIIVQIKFVALKYPINAFDAP